MVVKCYAKLNLYLEVINKRKDGFHNIKTIFERIDLHDKIILQSLPEGRIEIDSDHKDLPKDSSNLAYRAAKLLQDGLNIKKGVKIKIIKNTPIGSGLGGGSSDATGVLIGLNKLWGLSLSQKKIVDFANKIGSDCAFFAYDTPFAEATGRGEKITPLKDFKKACFWHILVVPKLKVPTPLIYNKWDEFKGRLWLTKPDLDVKLLYLALRKREFSCLGQAMFNSLEPITTKLYPEVRDIKEALLSFGLKSILMSGSGPAVFATVSSRKEAQAIFLQLRKEHKSWQVFVTRTV